MAYATYTTKAIVCGSSDSYTSDRSYLLFTEDAGMLWATARSAREERSRQRFALQDFSRIRVSLVRGRSGWRVGSVSALGNAFQASNTRSERTITTQVIRLVRQFVHGEEPQPLVFSDLETILTHIGQNEEATDPALVDIFTLRLLSHLGYIAPHSEYDTLLSSDWWHYSAIPLPPIATAAIKRAYTVSHL